MIKRIIFISLLAVLLSASVAHAQTPNGIDELPEPGLLPDSPFYFLKSWSEEIGTFFTFGDAAKAERLLDLSEKRLAEAGALMEKGKPEIAERVIGRYREHLNRALAKAETDEVLAKVAEATLKHQAVLADVYEKVPEQARSAIERAMQASTRGREEALKAISGEKQEEVIEQVEQKRQEVEQRLERLRDRGIPVPAIPKVEKPKVPAVESETPD